MIGWRRRAGGSPSSNRRTKLPRRARRHELAVLFGWGAVTATTFLVLAVIVWHANHPVGLDRASAELRITAGEEGLLGGHPRLARAAERLGTRTSVGLATAALVVVALICRDWVVGVAALLAPVGSFVLTEYFAKPLINEPIPFGGRAFPSGHAAGVAAVAVSALVLSYRRWGAVGSIVVAPLAVAAVLAVGLGVLALGFHPYPTDVAGGVALGATVVLGLTAVLELCWRAWSRRGGPRPSQFARRGTKSSVGRRDAAARRPDSAV